MDWLDLHSCFACFIKYQIQKERDELISSSKKNFIFVRRNNQLQIKLLVCDSLFGVNSISSFFFFQGDLNHITKLTEKWIGRFIVAKILYSVGNTKKEKINITSLYSLSLFFFLYMSLLSRVFIFSLLSLFDVFSSFQMKKNTKKEILLTINILGAAYHLIVFPVPTPSPSNYN